MRGVCAIPTRPGVPISQKTGMGQFVMAPRVDFEFRLNDDVLYFVYSQLFYKLTIARGYNIEVMELICQLYFKGKNLW